MENKLPESEVPASDTGAEIESFFQPEEPSISSEPDTMSKFAEAIESQITGIKIAGKPEEPNPKAAAEGSKPEQAPPPPQVKMFSFKSGDSEIQVPEDAVIEVLVDGQPQQVSISEIRNGISGTKAISKRFASLDVEKKRFEQKQQHLKSAESAFKQALDNGDAKSALKVVLDTTGIPPETFYTALVEQLAPTVQEFLNTPPEVRERQRLESRSKAYNQQLELVKQENERLKAQQEITSRIESVKQSYNISDGTFLEAYDSLMNDISKGVIEFEPSKVTPEVVGEYVKLCEFQDFTVAALKEVRPDLVQNHKVIMEFTKWGKKLSDEGHKMDAASFNRLVSEVYKSDTKPTAGKPKESPKATPSPSAKPRSWMESLDNDLQSGKPTKEVFKKYNFI